LESAIGDAYGAAFEFIEPDRAKAVGLVNNAIAFQNHPELPIGGGRYTDDTQMTIAVVEAMLSGKEITKQLLADKFVEVFKRDERKGYGSKFYNLLWSRRTGPTFWQKLILTPPAAEAACGSLLSGYTPI
jgi:ADP-ribosyl-[dinitrogen reductase] hydrolase